MKVIKEIWREYPLDFNVVNKMKLEISNLGRCKTYNSRNPEGKILNGTLQGGYPIIRLKLFKDRTPRQVQKILDYNERIDAIQSHLNTLGNSQDVLNSKIEFRKQKQSLIKERSRFIKKNNLKRTINFSLLIHKAVAELFLEKPADSSKKFVIHKDFDKKNNHADNLKWASQEDLNSLSKLYPNNILFAFKKQFEDKVPNTKMGKLQENEVLHIKQRLKRGDSLRKIAQKFGVSDMQIHRIKTGENWSHVRLLEDILEEQR